MKGPYSEIAAGFCFLLLSSLSHQEPLVDTIFLRVHREN